jgi:ribonuclease HII
MRALPDMSRETAAGAAGLLACGVDEAGRGPLAGPVVAAAVILDPHRLPPGLDDSKRLAAAARRRLAAALAAAAEVAVGIAGVAEIDRLNILAASHLAMRRAVAALPRRPGRVLVDGPSVPADLGVDALPVVGGDALSLSIAAASIVAKVTRDAMMVDLAQQFPGYGWERNMGYGTAEHLAALKSRGATPHHRRSFAPVHNMKWQEDF